LKRQLDHKKRVIIIIIIITEYGDNDHVFAGTVCAEGYYAR
jgi:hypothetical protein